MNKNIILALLCISFSLSINANNREFVFTENEIVSEIHMWNSNLLVLSIDGNNNFFNINYLSQNGEPIWNEKIPVSKHSSIDLVLKDDKFILLHKTKKKHYHLVYNSSGKVSEKLLPEGIFWGRNLGYIEEKDHIELVWLGTLNKIGGYYVIKISDEGQVLDQLKLNLTPLERGRWAFGGKVSGKYFFHGCEGEFTKEGNISCYLDIIDEEGNKFGQYGYPVKLDDNKFPSFSEMNPYPKDNLLNLVFEDSEKCFYLYGYFTNNYKNRNPSPHGNLRVEGFFIHKISSDGKLLFKEQYLFQDIGITTQMLSKWHAFFVNKNSNELVFGFNELNHAGKQHTPYAFVVDKRNGSFIESFKGKSFHNDRRTFLRAEYITFNSTLSSTQKETSSIYKGFNNSSKVSWISDFINAVEVIPASNFFMGQRYFICYDKGKAIVLNFDYTNPKRPVLKVL